MAGKRQANESKLELPRAHCSWEGCSNRADLRAEIEPGKGLHNLCEFHYVHAHSLAAKRRCAELGLHTVEQMRAFCRLKFRGVLKPMLGAREPGQDDE